MIRVAVISLAACLVSPAAAQTLHTTGAIFDEARLFLVAETAAWRFELGTDSTRSLTIERAELVRWGTWSGILSAPAVWLQDGGWVCGSLNIEDGKQIRVESDWLQLPPIPMDIVRGLVLTPPASFSRWQQLRLEMAQASGQQDALWLSGGRRLNGIIRWPPTTWSETSQLNVEAGGQILAIAVDEIQAIVLSPALTGKLPARQSSLQVGLVDGTLLHARSLELATSEARVTLASGLEMQSLDPPTIFGSEAITFLAQPPGDERVVLLSDLDPASYRHVADSTLAWQLGVDRDLYGFPLATVAGQAFRGLAMHSSSQVAYRWDGSPGKLLAEIVFAVPHPQADPRTGSVSCRVMIVRSSELETVTEISMQRGASSSSAQTIDVDVSGAKLIVLVTEKADYRQFGDHVLWLDARVNRLPRAEEPR